MSNHFHLVVQDTKAELPYFMNRFESALAKQINRIDQIRGPLFEGRFEPGEILDRTALLERIAYTVANPCASNLVGSCAEWPGILRWAGDKKGTQTFSKRYANGTTESFSLSVEPLNETDRITLARMILLKLKEARNKHLGKPPLGRRAVLAQDPFSAPESPKMGRPPSCYSTDGSLRDEHAASRRLLRQLHRASSIRLRAGETDVEFPPYTFKPWVPVRPPTVKLPTGHKGSQATC